MAQLKTKIKLYAKANGVANIYFKTDVRLQDDSNGAGVYIKEWNLDIAEPTDTQIASYETAGNTVEALQTVLNNRANDYPSIADQLDKIYHSGIEEWKKVIKATKDKYPK
jgi:hypothetical protein